MKKRGVWILTIETLTIERGQFAYLSKANALAFVKAIGLKAHEYDLSFVKYYDGK